MIDPYEDDDDSPTLQRPPTASNSVPRFPKIPLDIAAVLLRASQDDDDSGN